MFHRTITWLNEMKRRKLSRPKHLPSGADIGSLPSPSSLTSSPQPGIEKLPTSLTDHISPDKPPKLPQSLYNKVTSSSALTSESSHAVAEHNYLNLRNPECYTLCCKTEEDDYQIIHEKGTAVTSQNSDDITTMTSQTNGYYHGSQETLKGDTYLPLSDHDIQKICSDIVSTLGNLGADISDISRAGKYKREDLNSANLAVGSRTPTPASEDDTVTPASTRNCSVHTLESSSELSLEKQRMNNIPHQVPTHTSARQLVNKEQINMNYTVSLSAQLSVALSTSLSSPGVNPVLAPIPPAITSSGHVPADPLSSSSDRSRIPLDKPPKHPQKPLRYIRKRSLKFKRIKRKVKKHQHIVDSSTVADNAHMHGSGNPHGQSRSLLINKLISLYRKLQQRCKSLEATSSKPKLDNPPKSQDVSNCANLNDISSLQRYMNTCYQMLKQQLSTYEKKVLLEKELKVFQVDDIPTRVACSRDVIRRSSLPTDTLFQYLFGKELKPSAVSVKYDRRVRIPSQEVCRRIINEVPPTTRFKTIPPKPDQTISSTRSEGSATTGNNSTRPSEKQNTTSTDNNRQYPTLEFSRQCFTSSDGGGIRYQVPDITLVGGSFFLPKTQLVHGTNWWVYCPFSKKTVSTWY